MVNFVKIKKLAGKTRMAASQAIERVKESRKPEVQMAKIKQKQELLKAKAGLHRQRQALEQEKVKLRGLQLKSTGINAPKFIRGTERLGAFASGGSQGVDLSGILNGGQQQKRKKKQSKVFNPFSQF